MQTNRRRYANIVPLASLTVWILIASLVCGSGLYYVYSKQQLIARGSKIHALEKELNELQNLNEEARSLIAMRTSPSAIRLRRDRILASYTDITQDHLVVIQEKSHADELRTVANVKP
jgi:hypothetical protein